MKSMLVACLIAIALLTNCPKDGNPVDPYTDPNKITTVNIFYVQFNPATNDWDMSTKKLGNIMKIDHKGSFYKRLYNHNFTANPKSYFLFLMGEDIGTNGMFPNLGCMLSDSNVGINETKYSYSNDESANLAKKAIYDDNAHIEFTDDFVSENGRIKSIISNHDKNIYFEYGTNDLVSKTYTIDSKGQKIYEKYYFHDNNGFVTKFIDSSDYKTTNEVNVHSINYDSQNRLSEYIRNTIRTLSQSVETTKYYYDNDGYLIRYTYTMKDKEIYSVTLTYDSKHLLSEMITNTTDGKTKWKLLFEYKTVALE